VDATPFGHYQLRKLIGRGGMGEVYRAYDTKTDRIVALKVLPLHLAEDATFQQRFRRESQAAAGLNDPHVVPIHGYGEIDGRLYLDMRLIEGRNLGTMLEDSDNPLGAPFAVKVVEQVATALDAAHEAGLIHRDVKPSNVLITDREFVYLIDFGLARTAGEKGLTTAGNTLGTLAYMAPERFDGAQIDPRADIYALTCVLYECITGSRPYPAESYEQQIKGHMVSPPPRPSAIDPKLAAFDSVIAKGMAKKPAKRYQTAGELAAAARRALETPVRTTGRSGKHSKQRSRRVSRRALAIAAVVVLVAGLGTFGAWQWRGGSGGKDTRPANVAESSSTATRVAVPGAVAEIAATVPETIRKTGRLVIGVNVPYAPNEFKNSAGEIVGFDVDLMNAVAKTLGLTPDYRETAFESIMPSVSGGSFNVGMSSFTDNKEREANVGRSGCSVRLEDWGHVCVHPRHGTGSGQERSMCRGRRFADREGRLHAAGRPDGGLDRGRGGGDGGRFTGDGVRGQAQWRKAGAGGGDLRHRAVRLAGRQGVGAGGVAEEGPGAPDADRRVQDHRHGVGRREGHDRHAGDQWRDSMTDVRV
jgi:predicted Ser/Thr protein kinase